MSDGDAIQAATVVLVRDAASGLETLMLRKNAKLAFGGMWVFPGGRVDPGDGEGEHGARRAAVREAEEEAGLFVTESLLVPFAHWTPPAGAPRRYATWFFLAPAPEGGEVVIDGGEIHEHVWLHPAHILRRHDGGEVELAPPTWLTLHGLAEASSVADAVAWAHASPMEHYHTRLGRSANGDLCTMWHGDAGYESGEADTPGPRHRLWMRSGGWRFERDC